MKVINFKDSGFYFDSSQFSKKHRFGARSPVVLSIKNQNLDLAIGVYEKKNRTYISRISLQIDLSGGKPFFKILSQSVDKELIKRGKEGTYSEWGIIPSCCLKLKNKYALYTIGFDSMNKKIFNASSGLAYLNNSFDLINHLYGPILNRSTYDTCFAASPFVLKIKKNYKMFYTASSKYAEIKDNLKHHFYNIKMKVSKSESNFSGLPIDIINSKSKSEYAIARPALINFKKKYYLFYCKRETIFKKDYAIFCRKGYDLEKFKGKEDFYISIKNLQDPNFIECQCYPYLFQYKNYLFMLFNGKNYGKTGFRIAYCKLNEL